MIFAPCDFTISNLIPRDLQHEFRPKIYDVIVAAYRNFGFAIEMDPALSLSNHGARIHGAPEGALRDGTPQVQKIAPFKII